MFKGGTALKRCYFGDYRFSEDLDFTLTEPSGLDAIVAGLEGVYAEVQRASGIVVRLARADRKSHRNSHTFYLSYEGPLPAASPKEVKVDITIREQLVRPVVQRPVLRGYEEYADLPEDALVHATGSSGRFVSVNRWRRCRHSTTCSVRFAAVCATPAWWSAEGRAGGDEGGSSFPRAMEPGGECMPDRRRAGSKQFPEL